MSYPRLLDYAGGQIAGADLVAAGVTGVCRYVTSGGTQLPAKQLTAQEFTDLIANGIAVVFNWEAGATNMLGGAPQGTQDAQAALANIRALPGVPANYQPVIYFSADFDATPDQQAPINAYLQAAAAVLGGPQFVGIYGGYWPLSRALDAGVCNWAWQTEAWSGGNIDSRVNLVQRNSLGYQTIDGVQADVDQAHTPDYGQFSPTSAPSAPGAPVTQPTSPTTLDTVSASQSRYAAPGIAYPLADYILFIDARTHEAEVERYALLGDPGSVALVEAAATNGDTIAQIIAQQIKSSPLPAAAPKAAGKKTN